MSSTSSITRRRARKGGRRAAEAVEVGRDRFTPGPEYTPHMVKKARGLVANCLCALIGDGSWQVCSSDGSSYLVSTEPAFCQCMSFKIRRVCSHVLAIQMIEAGVGAGNGYGGDGPEECSCGGRCRGGQGTQCTPAPVARSMTGGVAA